MRYRKLSPTGDYVFGHNQQDFLINSPATVAQAILTALKLLQGEWFLDSTKGVPWLQQVAGRKTTFDQVIQNAVRNVQGVVDLDSYSSLLSDDNRVLTISETTVSTVYGAVTLNGVEVPTGWGSTPFGNVYGE